MPSRQARRIPTDAQTTKMVKSMMSVAQSDEIQGIRCAAILPMLHMVHMEPPGAFASGHPAPPVALLDDHAGPLRHRTEGPPDAHRAPLGLEHRPHASQLRKRRRRRSVPDKVEVAADVGVRLGSDVQQHEVTVAMGAGCRPHRPVGHGHEGIGPPGGAPRAARPPWPPWDRPGRRRRRHSCPAHSGAGPPWPSGPAWPHPGRRLGGLGGRRPPPGPRTAPLPRALPASRVARAGGEP